MELLFSLEAAKAGTELISALARLAEESRASKHPSIQQVYVELHGEAIAIARRLDHSLDSVVNELRELDIPLYFTMKQAELEIAKLSLLKRVRFGRATKRLRQIAGSLKDFYADVEHLFACSEHQGFLTAGIESAYDVRWRISAAMDAKLSDQIDDMRKVVLDALKMLGG